MANGFGGPSLIFEGTMLTARAEIPPEDVEFVEEVKFRFLRDGEQVDEKTVPVQPGGAGGEGGAAQGSEGGEDAGSAGGGSGGGNGTDSSSSSSDSSTDDTQGGDGEAAGASGPTEQPDGSLLVTHDYKAPAVPDDQESYVLDLHFFYKLKMSDGTIEPRQSLEVSRHTVVPRTAQVKVVWATDDKPFLNFRYDVFQRDTQVGATRSTFLKDFKNAKDDTVPAGSGEFDLELARGFRLRGNGSYVITEETVAHGRKREVKGDLVPRAKFVTPEQSSIRQFVNYPVQDRGQMGFGDEMTIDVGVEDAAELLESYEGRDLEVHFRTTFGPPAGETVEKSERDDADHPTKAMAASESDNSVTVEEKEAKKIYQGKITLDAEGRGKFKVSLGQAGGDTCKVEIAGTDRFFEDEEVAPDETLEIENWRRVYVEYVMPDVMEERASPVYEDALRRLNLMGEQIFVEFVEHAMHTFDAMEQADLGTLAPRRFLGEVDREDELVYVLSGRNWRKLPEGESWSEEHVGKKLHVVVCDNLLLFRTDTDDEKQGTTDFSGTLTEAEGWIDVEEKLGGLFMPFSGYDGGDGIADVEWTADISKDDDPCKYTAELKLDEERERVESAAIGTILDVVLVPDPILETEQTTISFERLPYPGLDVEDKSAIAGEEDKDDGKVTLTEPNISKDLTLEFDVSQSDDEGDSSDDSGDDDSDGDAESDSAPGGALITSDHEDQLDAYFKDLFKEGKDTLAADDESNEFVVEVHGQAGDGGRSNRIAAVAAAVEAAYARTQEHDQHDFKGELSDDDNVELQGFVDSLLASPERLHEAEAKVSLQVYGPLSTEHAEDDCFSSVTDKLQELFDASDKKEFVYHPGLDNEQEPRTGTLAMRDVTNGPACTVTEWHFVLPSETPEETVGPGAFVGSKKTASFCPVKVAFATQAHQLSEGEVDGNLLAWICDPATAPKQLLRLCLRGFLAVEDEAALDHGHGDDGEPGDCLAEEISLCEDCVKHARSKDLTRI